MPNVNNPENRQDAILDDDVINEIIRKKKEEDERRRDEDQPSVPLDNPNDIPQPPQEEDKDPDKPKRGVHTFDISGGDGDNVIDIGGGGEE